MEKYNKNLRNIVNKDSNPGLYYLNEFVEKTSSYKFTNMPKKDQNEYIQENIKLFIKYFNPTGLAKRLLLTDPKGFLESRLEEEKIRDEIRFGKIDEFKILKLKREVQAFDSLSGDPIFDKFTSQKKHLLELIGQVQAEKDPSTNYN